MSEQSAVETTIELDPTRPAFGPDERIGDLGRTHFIGIGGAGMSVLAEMLHEQGVVVDGSDREPSPKTDRLQSLGVAVQFGQRAQNVAGAATVVYSSAIKPDNPEIVAAHAAGARIVHRSDILALLMAAKRAVTVAGAHGKTTTSSLLAHILVNAGTGELADPSYAIGGSIQSPDGTNRDGGHAGHGAVLVAEADESDGSFAKYRPSIAIVTNAEPDHLDHYGTADRYHRAFVDHIGHARDAVVMCADDEGCLEVLRAVDADVAGRVVVYTTQDPDTLGDLNGAVAVRIESERERERTGCECFTLRIPPALADGAELEVPVELSIPGIHNARNAAAAIIAAGMLGMSYERAARAAASFLGAARRFQVCGCVNGVTVVDDYAHHPTEIAALLDAARRRYPQSRIHVLFQPHLYSRTRIFAEQFAQALSKADDVIVAGIFPAREKQEDFPDVSASTIVQAAGADRCADAGEWIRAVEDMRQAAVRILDTVRTGDVVITVGAGDINRMDDVLLHELSARAGGMES